MLVKAVEVVVVVVASSSSLEGFRYGDDLQTKAIRCLLRHRRTRVDLAAQKCQSLHNPNSRC